MTQAEAGAATMHPATQHRSAPHAYPSLTRASYSLAVLMTVTFTALLDRYLIGLLLEPIKAEFAIGDTQASLLQGLAFALFYSLLALPFGRLVDRGNRRNILVVGALIWSVMTVGCGLAPTYEALFIARIGVGFGEACLAPAAYSLITDLFARERHGRALATFTLASIVGAGGSFILGAQALALATSLQDSLPGWAPWRLTFIIVGAPGLVVALLMLTVREPARHQGDFPAAHPTVRELLAFLRSIRRPLTGLIVAHGLAGMGGTGVVSWLAVFLLRNYGMPVTEGAYWIGITLIGSAVVGGWIGGWIADSRMVGAKMGRKVNVVAFGGLFAGPLALAFPFMPTVPLAMALFLFYCLFYNIQVCAAPAALQDIVPNRFKGQVAALYWLVVGLTGLGGGSTAVALVTDHVFGDEAALRYSIALVPAVCFGGATAILLMIRKSYHYVLKDSV